MHNDPPLSVFKSSKIIGEQPLSTYEVNPNIFEGDPNSMEMELPLLMDLKRSSSSGGRDPGSLIILENSEY